MKKILLLFAICTICSCTRTDVETKALLVNLDSIKNTRTNNSIDNCIKEVNVKGHIYLIYDGYHEGNIIHAEHCPCKASKKLN